MDNDNDIVNDIRLNIKNITPDSVKVLRYRLRKRFNLPTKTTLPEFLNEF